MDRDLRDTDFTQARVSNAVLPESFDRTALERLSLAVARRARAIERDIQQRISSGGEHDPQFGAR